MFEIEELKLRKLAEILDIDGNLAVAAGRKWGVSYIRRRLAEGFTLEKAEGLAAAGVPESIVHLFRAPFDPAETPEDLSQ